MSTKYPDLFAALIRPFDQGEIKQCPGRGGRKLDYVTARTVMNRLDSVLGPENWEDDYDVSRGDAWICKLTITLPDGRRVTKQGVGVNSKSVGEDAEKGGESDALKRAAAKFGVGRHLYQDGIVDFTGQGIDTQASKSNNQPPDRTDDRRPAPRSTPPPAGNGTARGGGVRTGDLPNTGRGLWAWACGVRENGGPPKLIEAINAFGKVEGFPKRMVDWDPSQVERAVRKCQEIIAAAPAGAAVPAPAAPPAGDQDDDIPF